MGNQQQGDWEDFAPFNPFNQAAHYHPYCQITDFTNQHEVCLQAEPPTRPACFPYNFLPISVIFKSFPLYNSMFSV